MARSTPPEPGRTSHAGRGLGPIALAIAAVAVGSAAPAPPARAEAPAPALEFRRHGEHVATQPLEALAALARPAEVAVLDPYEEREVRFRALPLRAILDAVYSEAWRATDRESDLELLFTCRDGYQPTIPVARAIDHTAWLAFERVDGGGFAIRKFESGRWQRIDLTPFYLVWENQRDVAVRRDGDYGWPYQLIGIELVRARDRFPGMAPPKDASAAVREGFAAFRVHCSRCHTVNGEGGKVGPELNAPANAVGRRDPAWLRGWIDDPSRILANTRMPALNPELPDRERTLDAIVAYLQAISDERR